MGPSPKAMDWKKTFAPGLTEMLVGSNKKAGWPKPVAAEAMKPAAARTRMVVLMADRNSMALTEHTIERAGGTRAGGAGPTHGIPRRLQGSAHRLPHGRGEIHGALNDVGFARQGVPRQSDSRAVQTN